MPRKIVEFQIHGSQDAVQGAVSQYLMGQGFQYTDYEFEDVFFFKGKTFSMGPSIVKGVWNGNILHLEAWSRTELQFGVHFGEKEPGGDFRSQVDALCGIISQYGREVEPGYVAVPHQKAKILALPAGLAQEEFATAYMCNSVKNNMRSAMICQIVWLVLTGGLLLISQGFGLTAVLSLAYMGLATALYAAFCKNGNAVLATVSGVMALVYSLYYLVSGIAAYGMVLDAVYSDIYASGAQTMGRIIGAWLGLMLLFAPAGAAGCLALAVGGKVKKLWQIYENRG